MFKIDKRPDDNERNKDPISDRYLPREGLPGCQEKKRREQFHRKIAECDFVAAVCAAAAQHEPTDQRQILVPGNRLLASRTKRTARFVDRKIERQPINADVQERANHRAENEREHAEHKFVTLIVHKSAGYRF